MTKYYTILIFLLVACSSNEKDNQLNVSTSGLTSELVDSITAEYTVENGQEDLLINHDTIFIERRTTEDYYHAIYIEQNRNSAYHQRLVDFELNEYNVQNYGFGVEYFTEELNQSFEKQKLPLIPTCWVPLYVYQDSFYLYAPSDWGNTGRIMFNDSAYVYWNMDGPNPIPLRSLRQINATEFVFTTAPHSDQGKAEETRIYIVNEKNNMAIFENQNSQGRKYQRLYIPIESVSEFNMIVNYCNNQKQYEYQFERIDLDYLKTKAHTK